MYPLSVLSHYPLGHIIYSNQSPIIDTVFIQLLTIVSKPLALPYTAYDLSKDSTQERKGREGKKGRKKLYKKNESHTSKNLDPEKNWTIG